MIIKKTGLVVAAAAAIILSGCSLGSGSMTESSPVCDSGCAAPANTCKGMSKCKSVSPVKKHKKHKKHRACRAENDKKEMSA